MFDQFEAEFNKVINSIDLLEKEYKQEKLDQKKGYNLEEVKKISSKLKSSLEDSDPIESKNYLEQLKSLLAKEKIKKLILKINNYEFETALEELNEVINNL